MGDDDKPGFLQRAVIVLVQILVAALLIAAIGGLIGFLVTHFAHWGGAKRGFAWGMVAAGVLMSLVVGQSGSPIENLGRGRTGLFGGAFSGGGGPYGGGGPVGMWYFGQSSPLPQSPLQLAIGGLLSFAAGIAVFVLFGY